jgi:pentalenene oxygenase
MYQIIDAYRRDEEDHADLLSMLLSTRDENGEALTDQEIRDEAMTFVIAGSETSASLLAWTAYLLGQHPQIQERLHAELDAVLGDRLPRYDDVPKLKLTGRILSEALRMYPPVWMSTREVITRTELAGRVLHPGDNVMYSPYLLHHRADLYPEPDRFDPERWLPERRAERPSGSYLPFAAGDRKCIGDVFAIVEATLVLASVASRWRLQPLPGIAVRPRCWATLRPNTLPMRLHRRR